MVTSRELLSKSLKLYSLTVIESKIMLKPAELLDLAQTELEDNPDGYGGFCASCGEYHDNVEPDAAQYTCGNCGKPTVYGCENIVIVEGYVELLND
jgi:hypothetical protein